MKYIENDLLYAVGNSITGRVRSANEDNCGYGNTPNGHLFVVCDGMGGHVGGAVASKIAVDSILEYFSRFKYSDIPLAINKALEYANIQILGKAKENPELSGMGTTACVLLVEDDKVWIAHVGDSRIYLYSRSNATLHRITKDHSFVQGLVDSGQLDDREAENHPRKNVILKALGLRSDLVIDVPQKPVIPAKDDVFLICSDGLSGMLDDDVIEHIMGADYDLNGALEVLLNDANEPGKGKDNITAQLIRIKQSEFRVSSFPDFNPNWRKHRIDDRANGQDRVQTGDFTSLSSRLLQWKLWVYSGIIGLLLILALSLLLIKSDRYKKDIQPEIKERIDSLNKEIENQKVYIDGLSKSIDGIKSAIEEIEEITEKGDTELNSDLKKYEQNLELAKEQLKAKEDQRKALQESVSDGDTPEKDSKGVSVQDRSSKIRITI